MTRNTAPVSDSPPSSRRKSVKKARRITANYLHNAALYYLERYAASTGHLRSILMNKIRRSCRDHPDQDPKALFPLIDKEIETLTRVDLLNDEKTARMFLDRYCTHGLSRRMARTKLMIKEFDPVLIDRLLAEIDPCVQKKTEQVAARRYLEKRKLWPFNETLISDPKNFLKQKQKSWAALARKGYGPNTITHVFSVLSQGITAEDDWPEE